jgi:hypothetical protein
VIFHTPGRVDVEPLSVADSLRECAAVSTRAWQAAVDDVEDKVVKVFFSGLSAQSSRNIFLQIVHPLPNSFFLYFPDPKSTDVFLGFLPLYVLLL